MADAKITSLTNYTQPISTDVLPIVDISTSTTKKVTWANLFASPTLITPVLGVATATSINKVALTQPAAAATLTIANNKTLTVNNSITLTGTDGTTMTLPGTSATLARTDAANIFTGTQTISTIATPVNTSLNVNAGSFNTIQSYTPGAGGTATLDLSKGNIHHVQMPVGNITIALSNPTAGQCFFVRITQDSSGSRTTAWFTTIKWAGGSAPTLTTTANKSDTIGFEITGTNTYDGIVVGQAI